ncbi:MAG TPA: LytR C-terminal domain-containing protein [Acidimicrobiales bacterium]|nr:LytR C-terminal domain-containing protein [Acidimicrobiales bacterium]
MPDDGPQHSGGMTGSLKAARAAVVLVVFAVAVAILVAVGTRSTPTTSSSALTTSTTAAAGGSTTTTAAAGGATSSTTTSTTSSHSHGHGAATTTTTVAHASVSVVVANATSTNGLAAHYSTVIGGGGWKMGTPIDASTMQATSTVYYAAGQQAAAQAIATAIGVKPTQVQPLTTAAPVAGVTGTDVVVVVGQDLAAAANGS